MKRLYEKEYISNIDTNKNGQVSVKEAKAAGYKMSIIKGHYLYKYMIDGDDSGMASECPYNN